MKNLPDSTWPADIDLLHSLLNPQSEMYRFVPRREMASARSNSCLLLPLRSYDSYVCADRIPVAFVADELQSEPVIVAISLVVQDGTRSPILRDDCIEASVIVDIPGRHSATHPAFVKNRSG